MRISKFIILAFTMPINVLCAQINNTTKLLELRLFSKEELTAFCNNYSFRAKNSNGYYKWEKWQSGTPKYQLISFLPGINNITNKLIYATNDRDFYISFTTNYASLGFQQGEEIMDENGYPVKPFSRRLSNSNQVVVLIKAIDGQDAGVCYVFTVMDYVEYLYDLLHPK